MENENVTLSDITIQWHPAFCAAAELELSANRADLDFQREYTLRRSGTPVSTKGWVRQLTRFPLTS